MKHLLLSAAALVALGAQPALAQTSTLNVTGTVPPLCSTGMNAVLNLGLDWVGDGNIIDANGEFDIPLTATGESLALAAIAVGQGPINEAWCNGVNSTVSYTLTPLQRTAGNVTAPGFVSHVGVSSSLTLGGQSLTADALNYGDVTSVSGQTTGVFAGGLSGTISYVPPASGVRLVAGSYLSVATVTLTPAG